MASNDYFVIKKEHENGPWDILCSLINDSNGTKEHISLIEEEDIEEEDVEKKLEKSNYKFRYFESQLFFEDSFLVTCTYCKKNIQIYSITSHHTECKDLTKGCQASSLGPVDAHNSSLIDSPLIEEKPKSICVKKDSVNKVNKRNSGRNKKCQDLTAGCQASPLVPVEKFNCKKYISIVNSVDSVNKEEKTNLGCQDLIAGCQALSLNSVDAHNSLVDSPLIEDKEDSICWKRNTEIVNSANKVKKIKLVRKKKCQDFTAVCQASPLVPVNAHNSSPVDSLLLKEQEKINCKKHISIVNSVDSVNKEEKTNLGCQDLIAGCQALSLNSVEDSICWKRNTEIEKSANKVKKIKWECQDLTAGCQASLLLPVNAHNSSPIDSLLLKEQEKINCTKHISIVNSVDSVNKEEKSNLVTVKSELFNHVTEANSTELQKFKGRKRKNDKAEVVKNETEVVKKKPFLGDSGFSAVNPKSVENSVPSEPPDVTEKPLNQSFLYLSRRLYCASTKISANRLRHSNCGLVLVNGYTGGIRESMMKVFNNQKSTITNVEKNNLQHRKEPFAPPLLVQNSTMPTEDLLKSTYTSVKRPPNNETSNGNSKLSGNSKFTKQVLVNGNVDGSGHLNGYSPS